MNKAKKLILIGLDCILSFFIEKYVKEELMPATAELIEEGVFGEALPSPPCDTPTNWTTIVTGAWTGTHGMTSFYAHIPGKPLNEGVSTLDSRVSKAEFLWNVAERHGKLCVVMNYPVAWPPTIKKGIVIGGPAPGAAP
ncbi:MAG: nucleotide pyrophosphatase, partial [Thermoprotei archaeon]